MGVSSRAHLTTISIGKHADMYMQRTTIISLMAVVIFTANDSFLDTSQVYNRTKITP